MKTGIIIGGALAAAAAWYFYQKNKAALTPGQSVAPVVQSQSQSPIQSQSPPVVSLPTPGSNVAAMPIKQTLPYNVAASLPPVSIMPVSSGSGVVAPIIKPSIINMSTPTGGASASPSGSIIHSPGIVPIKPSLAMSGLGSLLR